MNNNEIVYDPNKTFGFFTAKLLNIIVVTLGIVIPIGYSYGTWGLTLANTIAYEAPTWFLFAIFASTLVAFCLTVKLIVDDNVQYISAKSLSHSMKHIYRNICIGIFNYCYVIVMCDVALYIQNKWFVGEYELGSIIQIIILTITIFSQVFVFSNLLPFRVVTRIK